MAGNWMPASPALSSVSAHSSASNSSAFSSSTTGSFAYVPPALRQKRNTAKVELDIANFSNDLAHARKEASKHLGPKLPYFNLPYCLNKQQLNFLTSRFPRTTFKCITDVMHDHPIAHTETMIGMEKIKRMVPQGHRIIDLFGSPGDCDNFNKSQVRANVPKSAIAYVARMTEKDYIRALKWGPSMDQQGRLRYVSSVTGDVVADIDPAGAHDFPGDGLLGGYGALGERRQSIHEEDLVERDRVRGWIVEGEAAPVARHDALHLADQRAQQRLGVQR
jgi:hypothetical protein